MNVRNKHWFGKYDAKSSVLITFVKSIKNISDKYNAKT